MEKNQLKSNSKSDSVFPLKRKLYFWTQSIIKKALFMTRENMYSREELVVQRKPALLDGILRFNLIVGLKMEEDCFELSRTAFFAGYSFSRVSPDNDKLAGGLNLHELCGALKPEE